MHATISFRNANSLRCCAVRSNYHHFLRSSDWRGDGCCARDARNLDLAGFAERDGMCEETVRDWNGKPLADLVFVGVAERFAESWQALGARCGPPAGAASKREPNAHELQGSD